MTKQNITHKKNILKTKSKTKDRHMQFIQEIRSKKGMYQEIRTNYSEVEAFWF